MNTTRNVLKKEEKMKCKASVSMFAPFRDTPYEILRTET